MYSYKHYQHITYYHPFYIIYITWVKSKMYIFSGTPSWDNLIKRDSALSPKNKSGCLLFSPPFPSFLLKKVCFAVQIPRKLDICMKPNIILSDKNDSFISDRQVRDCPDVIEKTVPQRIPRRYREDIKSLQERYDLHEGLVINVSLKEFRGICERDYPKIEAYLGLKKYLLRTFGVTLNIHSQKTKGDSDKNTAITHK